MELAGRGAVVGQSVVATGRTRALGPPARRDAAMIALAKSNQLHDPLPAR